MSTCTFHRYYAGWESQVGFGICTLYSLKLPLSCEGEQQLVTCIMVFRQVWLEARLVLHAWCSGAIYRRFALAHDAMLSAALRCGDSAIHYTTKALCYQYSQTAEPLLRVVSAATHIQSPRPEHTYLSFRCGLSAMVHPAPGRQSCASAPNYGTWTTCPPKSNRAETRHQRRTAVCEM